MAPAHPVTDLPGSCIANPAGRYDSAEKTGIMTTSENQKRERALRARAFLETLKTRYPACFTGDSQALRPLAIGIQQDLRKQLADDSELADTPGWLVRQALALYTRSPAYLEATMARRPRINLDGSDAGEIDDQAAEFARERREEQKARQAARRKKKPKPKKPDADQERQRKLEQLADKFNQS